jgi:sugar lactone lactonase YvrE
MGKYVVTCALNGIVYVSSDFGNTYSKRDIFDLYTETYSDDPYSKLNDIAISPDGYYLATCTSNGNVYASLISDDGTEIFDT